MKTLRRDPRFATVSSAELDLLLASVRARAEQDIGEILEDKADVDDIVRDIAEELEGAPEFDSSAAEGATS